MYLCIILAVVSVLYSSLMLPFLTIPEDPSVVREIPTPFQLSYSVAFDRTGHSSFLKFSLPTASVVPGSLANSSTSLTTPL